MPSMKDAFLEFCSLTTDTTTEVGTKTDGTIKKGAGKVSMGANSLGSQDAEDLFVSGEIGMFVDGRWEVTFLRRSSMETGYGVQAGHSGSVGLAISANSDKKNASAKVFTPRFHFACNFRRKRLQ